MKLGDEMERYTAGSLFSGIGGIDLAFSLAGFDILFQVEIDEFCQKVLANHSKEYWPHAEIFTDVRAVGQHNLPTVDILFGGFPCQDISQAGKREGLVAGKRSSLWFEFARIIGEIRPRIVLLENVEAITTPRKEENGEITPPDMGVVIDSLASLGYSARWGVIAAADDGAPHQRNRWFCVAYTERRGLLPSFATRSAAYQQNGAIEIEQFAGAALPSETKPDGDLLREKERLAYTNRRGRAERWGYRAKARQRLISTSTMGNTQSERQSTREPKFSSKSEYTEPYKPSCMVNANSEGLQRSNRQELESQNITRPIGYRKYTRAIKPRMGRNADGLSPKLDGAGLMAHRWPANPNEPQHDYEPPRLTGKISERRNRIKALGNAVVPQVVYPIAIEIKKLLDSIGA